MTLIHYKCAGDCTALGRNVVNLNNTLNQWCSNRGPQGPLVWPAKAIFIGKKI